MHGFVKDARIGNFRFNPVQIAQSISSVACQNKAPFLTGRIGQGIAHCVQAEQPQRFRRRRPPPAFLVDHPLRLFLVGHPGLLLRAPLCARASRRVQA